MKIDEILNDKTLCALSLFLILLWAGAKFRLYALPRVDGETTVATLLRIACGFLLVGASLDKIGDAAGFLGLIKECYFFIPASLQPLTAVVIPWLEFFTGLCLIFGLRWRGAALIFCVLMAVYTLAISWDVLHGIDCSCGCFSKDAGEKMTGWTVARDILFLAMGCIVLKSPQTYNTLEGLKGSQTLS
jgi:putative oxidoreductase